MALRRRGLQAVVRRLLCQTLSGTPAPSPWDPALAPAMQQRGLAIPEEAVAATLLLDLQR